MARLEAALVRLEAAAALKTDAAGTVNALRDDNVRLERDRAQLAAKLDDAEARAERLRLANQDVAGRLVKIMERVRRLSPPGAAPGDEEGRS
ncbi:DUF4164 family protein [Acuticoccus yangtzensis]|uniref:DUF4164 family protein n=1 Tax=Acuticoccus yangtzensis TaxID=1443441 RepID=UPI0009F7D920|nr:DUF4164 family protein [Acuticoccus yangtzensis]ORE96564.1 hypothetical protein ATO13_06860 [Stappia sp. 22II-S9-Z10]